MARITNVCLLGLTVVLLSALKTYTPAQSTRQNLPTDFLPRLFERAEAKHRGARRNLEMILRNQPQFLHELRRMAGRLSTDPAWLLNVMACESMFDPDARNPLPGQTASGLLQFVERTARRLGTTTEAVRRMSPVEQLGLIEKYLEPFEGRLKTLSDVYMAVLRGTIVDGGDAVVVVDSVKEPRIYDLNKSLDIDGDKRITKGELGLVALSVGRFLPAQSLQGSKERDPSSNTAFVRVESKKPQSRILTRSTVVTPADSPSRPPSPTRTIYVRKQ